MPRLCQGRSAEISCVFATAGDGRRAQVCGTATRCAFCDRDYANEVILSKTKRTALVRRFRNFPPDVQVKALEYVDPMYHAYLNQQITRFFCCPGLGDDHPCIFALSHSGANARTHKRHDRCLFCDAAALAERCETTGGRRQVANMLWAMADASQNKALEERVPEPHRDEIRGFLVRRSSEGQSRSGGLSLFAPTRSAAAASLASSSCARLAEPLARRSPAASRAKRRREPHAQASEIGGSVAQRLESHKSEPTRLSAASATTSSSALPAASLVRRKPAAAGTKRRRPAAARAVEARSSSTPPSLAPRGRRGSQRPTCPTCPGVDSRQRQRKRWAEVLQKRQSTAAQPTEVDLRQYRARILDDRSKARNVMGLSRERVLRGAPVNNDLDMPPAKRTRRAVDFERWCLYDSWALCRDCGATHPRELVQMTLERPQDPLISKSACRFCRSKQAPVIPRPEDVPAPLRGLPRETQLALSPVEIDCGPEIRAKDTYGRQNGYRQHASMIRFAWHSRSVQERVDDIENVSSRRGAQRALRFLLHSRDSAYAEFYSEHCQFLKKHQSPDDRQRRRWLRFIERVGVECALWPHLFWDVKMCLTWVREQDPRRCARRSQETLFDVLRGNVMEDVDGDEYPTGVGSVKRAYSALAASPLVDYAGSYELMHFAFDLNLWTALGAKKNLGLQVPMRLLMKGHSFSPEYWRRAHLSLLDLVRQLGYPKIFWTIAPFEWSWPYHELLRDHLDKLLRGRMHLPYFETLHLAHVMTQTVRGLLTGANQHSTDRACRQWTSQILHVDRSSDGITVAVMVFSRVEFQDGTRKDPEQDYHGSGRPHTHVLIWCDDLKSLALHQVVSASIPASVDDPEMHGYVMSSQLDKHQQTPWPVEPGPSRWDEETQSLRLHHTESDHELGVRAFFSELMESLRCHQDLQIADDDGLIRAYVTKYVPKFSDSMATELLNDSAEADLVAASVLSRYKPFEPEMALQLTGATFRQWQISTRSGGVRDFIAPCPGDENLPPEISQYEHCPWRGPRTTLLDFLRKTTADGEILHWLKQKHVALCKPSGSNSSGEAQAAAPSLQEFVRDYRLRGEKVVAAQMFSRFNDRFYGQWLTLNVPFDRLADFVKPEIDALVPRSDRYLAMAMLCEHPLAQRVWVNPAAIEEEMRQEAHAAPHRKAVVARVLAHVGVVRDHLDGRLSLIAQHEESQPQTPQQHSLPVLARYARMIADGRKRVEGRVNSGAAARVREGDVLVLGGARALVTRVLVFDSFAEMLRVVGFRRVLPDMQSLAAGVHWFHGFRGYRQGAAEHGVRAFELQTLLSDSDAPVAPAFALTREQERFKMYLMADLDRSLAVHCAATEDAFDSAREEAWRNNKIRVLEGPPGTGKTTVIHQCIEETLAKGGRVGFFLPTAALASRMRERYGDRIDVDTCHAAFGFYADVTRMGDALEPYALIVVDEMQQLDDKQFDHIDKLREFAHNVPVVVLAGDRQQLSGYGEARPWDSGRWRKATFSTTLTVPHRCKDAGFQRILDTLRTARPQATGGRGLTVEKIMRGRRAWRGRHPIVSDVRRLLRKYPETSMLAVTRRGAALLNDYALQASFPRRVPLTVLDGDAEANPENYDEHGRLLPLDRLVPLQVPIHRGMQVYLTRNVDKKNGFVNGMHATVESWSEATCGLRIITAIGTRVVVFRWTDVELGNMSYYPLRPGYASTVLKMAGAELPHVVVYLDAAHVPAAAYIAMSRVSYGSQCLIGGGVNRFHFTPAR